jgi:hypothetical protein
MSFNITQTAVLLVMIPGSLVGAVLCKNTSKCVQWNAKIYRFFTLQKASDFKKANHKIMTIRQYLQAERGTVADDIFCSHSNHSHFLHNSRGNAQKTHCFSTLYCCLHVSRVWNEARDTRHIKTTSPVRAS